MKLFYDAIYGKIQVRIEDWCSVSSILYLLIPGYRKSQIATEKNAWM